ncbi:MAG: hypothetical protein QXR18_05760 [Pyrobaculum sp.]
MESIISNLWMYLMESLTLIMRFIASLIESPIAAIITGVTLALAGRYIVYGVGLALIAYGVIRLALTFFGISL